uniref:uncharacterized protein C19orf44 homolog n=1 Tax=Semicossyphus pulcher TaxID=241346 RepID=UPI0037E965AD
MWKRGGRSSALDRAQALLSAKRNSRGDVQESTGKTRAHAVVVGGSAITRSALPNTHNLFSDLSDLSSVSSAPEHAVGTLGSAAVGRIQEREGDSTRDFRPQSSLGGGGSRFLKKAPPPATNTSHVPEPRYVSSSQRGSQNAALSRLANIESRLRSRTQAQEQVGQGPKPAENLTSVLGISPPPAAQSLEGPVHLSAQSSSDQSLKGKRFLKNNTAVAVSKTDAAAAKFLKGPDAGVRSRSKAAGVVTGVSLESDEEDMKKLLGDSLDSMDNSFFKPGRPSSTRTGDKMLSKSSPKVDSIPPPAASSSNAATPQSPVSPSRRSSPFRFTGQAQAHFSPSALSPSPSPPHVSPSPPRRLTSPHRAGSPQRSLSSMSGRSEVMSLEELFPVRSSAEDPQSEISEVSSEDFKINVMTLDDLVPANLGVTKETPGEKAGAKHKAPDPGSQKRHQLPRLKKENKEQLQEEEDVLDYQSDFESLSRTDPDNSNSQVSEHLQGHGGEKEVVSEVKDRTSDSDVSQGRTEEDYSSSFSDTSRSYTSQSSDRSQTLGRSRDSRSYRSSVSHNSRPRIRASTRTDLKDAAVQTQSDPLAYTRPAGMATLDPAVGMAHMVANTLSAEMVEALSTFNPAAYALNEILKQQLAMTRRFIESSRHLHSSLVQSLEPPNYRYTTLEDTKEFIRKKRPPKLTVEEAIDEVMQEMKEYHHIRPLM